MTQKHLEALFRPPADKTDSRAGEAGRTEHVITSKGLRTNLRPHSRDSSTHFCPSQMQSLIGKVPIPFLESPLPQKVHVP